MGDDKLIEIARSFEADAVDSKTHIKSCKPQHLVGLTANRAGFLRLAASCLRAATEPIVLCNPVARGHRRSLSPGSHVHNQTANLSQCFFITGPACPGGMVFSFWARPLGTAGEHCSTQASCEVAVGETMGRFWP